MFRLAAASLLAIAPIAVLPAAAQTRITHVDATGAVAGRSPHAILRPVAAAASCGGRMHLPAGKLPTYGTATPDPRCGATQIASADQPGAPARD